MSFSDGESKSERECRFIDHRGKHMDAIKEMTKKNFNINIASEYCVEQSD